MNKKIAIIGASGHGKVVADIAKKNGYTDIIFLDDNVSLTNCSSYRVVGTSDDAMKYLDRDFIVSIGNSSVRERIQNALMHKGVCLISLVHPNAVISEDVEIGEGTVVMAGAVVNSSAKIGRGCIINTSSSVDHDCVIGDFCHISVGSHVAGTVKLGDRTWIGAGATVINDREIVSDCMIGAGAVVIKDINESGVWVGVPAIKIK